MAQKIGNNYGRGISKRMPRRGVCPKCSKRGMKQPQPTPYRVILRSCMYCAHVERETV
jgi:hypothetical protein